MLTPRQYAMVSAFTRVLEDTGLEVDYLQDAFTHITLANHETGKEYSPNDLIYMMVKHLSEYDNYYDNHETHLETIKVINAFDIEVGYNEARDALETQGSVHEAIVEICKLRSISLSGCEI